MQQRRAASPRLRAVGPDTGLDATTRAFMEKRIMDLSRMYYLGWLRRQETRGVALENLDDDALCALLEKMERGRECRVEGMGFDEAGLVRQVGGFQ